MNVNNLVFFDKNGESYNFLQNEAGYWEGADYFLPISIALFDCSNLFILENTGSDTYKFPTMAPGSRFEIKWQTQQDSDNFFLFTVGREGTGTNAPLFLTKQDAITINYSDFGQTLTPLDLSYPLQLNVAFTPNQEKSYTRVLEINYIEDSTVTKVLEIKFYGEGEDEDERFRVWLQNFGVKFNKEDALILKDYDLKEGLVDWKQVNAARKNLLVNRDQVYPYVGTYKGLLNIIDLMGYADVLRVKEYWRDSDPLSRYYNNFAMIDVTDIMQIGDITKLDLVDLNGQTKKGGKFKKTEFLALAYQFTVASDVYDDDGLPEVISTTDFTVDEIFFKLHKFANKLKNEILPINVIIKDIIGEFIYFEKFNLRNWIDETVVEAFQINDTYKIKVTEPDQTSLKLKIRDIKNLYHKLGGVSIFPAISYNAGTVDPYEDAQKYPLSSLSDLRDAISAYYEAVKYYDFYQMGITSPIDNGDDTSDKIGCPVIFEAAIPDLTLQDLDGITFGDFIISAPTTSSSSVTIGLGSKTFTGVTVQDLRVDNRLKIYVTADPTKYMEGTITAVNQGTNQFTVNVTSAQGTGVTSTGWTITIIDQHYTISNLKYKNSYEVEWQIDGPRGYFFNWRERLPEIAKLPHILPNVGTYTVMVKVYDMHGGASIDYQQFTVEAEEPILQGFVKLQDKFKYTFGNLSNITLGDVASSSLYDVYANVLNANGEIGNLTEIGTHYLDWFTYSNRFGVGGPQDEIQIYSEGQGYVQYSQSTNPAKIYWGSGSANGQATLNDYDNSLLQELYHVDFSDFGMVGDSINGFYIDLRSLISATPDSFLLSLQYSGFSEINLVDQIIVPMPDEILNFLNTTTEPGWSNYRYELLGDRIKATAKFQDKKNHAIIKAISIVSGINNADQIYVPSYANINCLQNEFKAAGEEYYFQLASPSLIEGFNFVNLNDGDRVRVQNQIGQWIEGIICDINNNAIKITSDELNLTPKISIENQISSTDTHSITLGTKAFTNITGYMTLNPKNGTTLKIYSAADVSNWMIGTVVSTSAIAVGDLIDSITIDITQINGTGSNLSDWYITADGQISNFDILHVDRIYSFCRPKLVFNTHNLSKVQASLSQIGLKLDEDLLFLNCPFNDKIKRIQDPCRDAAAANIKYWIDRGYVAYDQDSGEQMGFLPSSYDENTFNLLNIKSTYDTLVVPTNHPIFIAIANLASNIESEWTLTAGSIEIVKVKTPSYFIWRFDDPGEYQLTVKAIDARNNTFEMQKSITVSRVMTPGEYAKYVERHLNERKRILVGNHPPPQI